MRVNVSSDVLDLANDDRFGKRLVRAAARAETFGRESALVIEMQRNARRAVMWPR